MPVDPSVDAFDADAVANDGYVYTTAGRLSTELALANQKRLVLSSTDFGGKSVIDIGCGDGFFTEYYFEHAKPRSMVGIDAASKAIDVAKQHGRAGQIHYEAADMHHLPFRDREFDLAMLHNVVHHDDKPLEVISEALRVAENLVILDPNGNNLGLKLLERTSRYHRDHLERSYRPGQMRKWIATAGGDTTEYHFGGFVAIFSPDWVARTMKTLEPLVENTPLKYLCAASVLYVVRHRSSQLS